MSVGVIFIDPLIIKCVTKYASKQTKIWESEVEVVASEKKIPITLHFVSMPVMPSSS